MLDRCRGEGVEEDAVVLWLEVVPHVGMSRVGVANFRLHFPFQDF